MLMRIASTFVVCRFSLVLSLPRSRFLDVMQRRCVISKKRLRGRPSGTTNRAGVVRFTRVRGRGLSLFSFLCVQHTFCTFLCHGLARLERETSRNFLVTRFMEEMLYVFLFTFFHCRSFSPWWPRPFLIFSPPL